MTANERGSVSTMFAVMGLFFFAMVSVVSEGGRKLGNISRAQDIAAETARAAAATLDVDLLAEGEASIDFARARDLAEVIVTQSGGDVEILRFEMVNADTAIFVQVEVRGDERIPGFSVDGTGSHIAQIIDPADFGP